MAAYAQLLLFEASTRTVMPAPVSSTPPVSPLPTPAPSRRRSQAWLALHLTDLPLAAAYNATPIEQRVALDTSAWAVIDQDRLKHVVACNERAWNDGVRPGHRMNAAIAFCSSLTLIPRDATAETYLLEQIANACLKYTSAVSVQPPHEVLLEVRGSLRLFGGATGLIERIQADLGGFNAGLQIALAPTARSAQWLARASTTPQICLPRELPNALNSLPIASLLWPLPIELQLTRFGVTTLGDLMRLSHKDLGRRIGAGPVRELKQAMGRTPWLHPGWSPSPSYHDRVLFDFEIETTTLLEKMLEQPLARLKRALIGAARTIDELNLTLKHREGATPLVLRLHQATADTVHLTRLLHEHLGRLVLRAPVREVVIEAPRLLVAELRNHALAMDPATRADLPATGELKAHLLEQLQSRLGTNAVRATALRDDHVPERAQHTQAPAPSSPCIAPPVRMPRRPLWLLQIPRPATREFQNGQIRLESSPETIEVEAWDGAGVRRAYYRARTERGAECWIYRDLDSPQHWFVHGLFG